MIGKEGIAQLPERPGADGTAPIAIPGLPIKWYWIVLFLGVLAWMFLGKSSVAAPLAAAPVAALVPASQPAAAPVVRPSPPPPAMPASPLVRVGRAPVGVEVAYIAGSNVGVRVDGKLYELPMGESYRDVSVGVVYPDASVDIAVGGRTERIRIAEVEGEAGGRGGRDAARSGASGTGEARGGAAAVPVHATPQASSAAGILGR